jgi:hypothetical protein
MHMVMAYRGFGWVRGSVLGCSQGQEEVGVARAGRQEIEQQVSLGKLSPCLRPAKTAAHLERLAEGALQRKDVEDSRRKSVS